MLGHVEINRTFEHNNKTYEIKQGSIFAVGEEKVLYVKLIVVDSEYEYLTSTWVKASEILKDENVFENIIGLFKSDIDNLNIDLSEEDCEECS